MEGGMDCIGRYGGDMGDIWGKYVRDIGREKQTAETHEREKFGKAKKAV